MSTVATQRTPGRVLCTATETKGDESRPAAATFWCSRDRLPVLMDEWKRERAADGWMMSEIDVEWEELA